MKWFLVIQLVYPGMFWGETVTTSKYEVSSYAICISQIENLNIKASRAYSAIIFCESEK